jgi:hypothetical protein
MFAKFVDPPLTIKTLFWIGLALLSKKAVRRKAVLRCSERRRREIRIAWGEAPGRI